MLSCSINLPDSVLAITLVALGTSLPDALVSMTAAKNSKFADSAIANVTGSNCLNVFLGMGIPWIVASHYNESKGNY